MGVVIAILLFLILWAVAPDLVAALIQLAAGLAVLAFWIALIGGFLLLVMANA